MSTEKHCCSTIRKYVSQLCINEQNVLTNFVSDATVCFVLFCFTFLCFVFASGMPRYKSQSQYNALCLVITVSVLVWLISRFCLQNSRKFTRSTLSPLKLGDHSLLISPLSQMYTYPYLRGFFKSMFSFVKKRDRGKIYTYFLKYEHVKLFPWLRVNSITSPKTNWSF